MAKSDFNWQGKRVLVTGAGGFIGSHLTEKLVELGAQTRAFVRYTSRGTWGWLDRSPYKADIEVIAGDITDRDRVHQAVKSVDIVFHLAALIGIPYSYHAPRSYVRTNIEGTLNILQAALETGVERVIHTSTSEVYGSAQYVPIDERHPLLGQSPYSATKIGADKLAESFHLSFRLPVVTVRPFNTYGPRQSARAVIPTIITQCMTRSTITLGNLTPTRDFNYVVDTAYGFICAAQSEKGIGHTINLGTGKEISIGDLVQRIARLMNHEVAIQSEAERVRPTGSEVNRLCAANQLAKVLLDWEPQHTLDEGLQLTIDWIGENFEYYRPNTYAI